jgi:hypothetical protein
MLVFLMSEALLLWLFHNASTACKPPRRLHRCCAAGSAQLDALRQALRCGAAGSAQSWYCGKLYAILMWCHKLCAIFAFATGDAQLWCCAGSAQPWGKLGAIFYTNLILCDMPYAAVVLGGRFLIPSRRRASQSPFTHLIVLAFIFIA